MKKLFAARIAACTGLAGLIFSPASAFAGVAPFTEPFAVGSSNWFDAAGLAPVEWVPAGGPDGSAFVSATSTFANLNAGDPALLFRAHDEFNSSNGAFVGDWVANNITSLEMSVRHDADVPLNFFIRFAGPSNVPGANHVFFIPVAGDTWTNLIAPLPNPNLIFEGPFTYAQVFTNVGHVQVGVSAPESLAGSDAVIRFDLDNVRIVPEPAALSLLCAGGVLGLLRRGGKRATRP